MDDVSWLAFLSALGGALLGTFTQFILFTASRSQKKRDIRDGQFDAFVSHLDEFFASMASIPNDATRIPLPAVLQMYRLQDSAQDLRKRHRSWVEKEAARRIDHRIVMMCAYSDVGQLGLIRHEIVRILKEWQRGSFDPDSTPIDQEASWAPRFPISTVNGEPGFPIAVGATRESSGAPQGPMLPPKGRRFLGLRFAPKARKKGH